jgi:hypothetical protein
MYTIYNHILMYTIYNHVLSRLYFQTSIILNGGENEIFNLDQKLNEELKTENT